MEFTPQTGAHSPTDLIPAGYLCWVVVGFRGMKNSKETQGLYGDMEYTVFEGQPFAKRKVWALIADPDDMRNSEKWREGGMSALVRMLESSGFLNVADPNSYAKFNGMPCAQILTALDAKRVAVRVSIEKGSEGYSDKNRIGDYLTPNPQSSGNKGFLKLSLGDHGLATAKPAAQTNMFPAPAGMPTGAPQGPFVPAPGAVAQFGQGPAQPIPNAAANPNAPNPPSNQGFNPSGPNPDWMNKQVG